MLPSSDRHLQHPTVGIGDRDLNGVSMFRTTGRTRIRYAHPFASPVVPPRTTRSTIFRSAPTAAYDRLLLVHQWFRVENRPRPLHQIADCVPSPRLDASDKAHLTGCRDSAMLHWLLHTCYRFESHVKGTRTPDGTDCNQSLRSGRSNAPDQLFDKKGMRRNRRFIQAIPSRLETRL